MDGYRRRIALAVVVGLFALSGADCPFMRPFIRRDPPPPRVLPPTPTLEQVIAAVNQNSAQIQYYSTDNATLSIPGWPSLQTRIAFQRPRQLRLLAGTGLTGKELDLGSNEQLFWFWGRRNQPPGIYYCGHDQFVSCRARQLIPVEPDWLIEALGFGGFDPGLPHEPPQPLPGDRLFIRTVRNTPEGPSVKITILDAGHAWVLEQHIYDAQNRLRASAISEGYHRDALSGVYLPATLRINCPAAQFSMRLDLGNVQVNRLSGNPAELWTMPTYPGSPAMDLCDPRFQPPVVGRR